jgi:hypothetical protein
MRYDGRRPGVRQIRNETMASATMAQRLAILVTALAAGVLALAAGCSSSTTPRDDPTTRALGDPMNYSPNGDQDISGGGLTDFHGDAFKKDMDHVLNP